MHVQLGNHLTPEQYQELRNSASAQVQPEKAAESIVNSTKRIGGELDYDTLLGKWIKSVDRFYDKIEKEHPEPYIKERMDVHITYFIIKSIYTLNPLPE
jgi:hypothetical protein